MGLLLLTLIILGLALHGWLFLEIQVNVVALTMFDKNNDPMKKHFLINLNILYVALQLVFLNTYYVIFLHQVFANV